MRLAVMYPHGIFSAWSVSLGLVNTFRRMGHEVLGGGLETVDKNRAKRVKPFPSWEELETVDAIVVSGPEHLYRFLYQLYPEWDKLKKPKVGYNHETAERADYGQLPLDEMRRLCPTRLYTPAIQDERHGFHYLPFGVDTAVFRPQNYCEKGCGELDDYQCIVCGTYYKDLVFAEPTPYKHDAIFIGLLYEKRQKFLQENKLDLKIGNVLVQDLDGVNLPKTNELYAQTLRESRVLVNLPSLCSHVVTKVSEALACGTAVVTPVISTGKEAENFAIFRTHEHLEYYDKNPKDVIDFLLNEPEYREGMARRGCEEVHKNHRLELRCDQLLQNL